MKSTATKVNKKVLLEVASAISSVTDADSVLHLLGELLTPAECQALALRWMLMKELAAGNSQRSIAKSLSISPCKITRGSKILKDPDSICRHILMKP